MVAAGEGLAVPDLDEAAAWYRKVRLQVTMGFVRWRPSAPCGIDTSST